uniref:Small ribosomal subunit protein uS10c n=1 Tax=Rhizophora mucronata TaxID=61149 RepID=A0A2P2JNB6_RHIMU
MAVLSSISTAIMPSLSISNSPSLTSKPAMLPPFSSFSLTCRSVDTGFVRILKASPSPRRVFAAPEVVESQDTLDPPAETLGGPDSDSFEVGDSEVSGSPSVSISADADKMAPKQKIRIKLRSFFVRLIEDSCKQIIDAAKTTNAKTMGPVPLPTKRRVYCVLKSPHVHKDARFHFEIRTHQRLIDILYPTAQTIDSLMQLDIPAGVDVEVKL